MIYVVVAYDISDDGRRARIAGILKDYGVRVQYSVFEAQLEERVLAELLGRLSPFPQEGDSIRVYRLCQACLKKVAILGKGELRKKPDLFVV